MNTDQLNRILTSIPLLQERQLSLQEERSKKKLTIIQIQQKLLNVVSKDKRNVLLMEIISLGQAEKILKKQAHHLKKVVTRVNKRRGEIKRAIQLNQEFHSLSNVVLNALPVEKGGFLEHNIPNINNLLNKGKSSPNKNNDKKNLPAKATPSSNPNKKNKKKKTKNDTDLVPYSSLEQSVSEAVTI